MKKINKRLFGAMFTTLLMGLTACNGVSKGTNPQSDNGVDQILTQPSIAIRKLSSGTDNNSHNYVTFSYTITPSNASDRSLITTLTWVTHNGWEDQAYYDSHINDYITASVNETNQTITVTCMQAFSNQANLNITCAANSDCYVDIPIDYEIRLDGFSWYELKQTSSYTINGNTVQPWWNGSCSSLSVNNNSVSLYSSEFINFNSYNHNVNLFNFNFANYLSRAALYSYGSVDNAHETLSYSLRAYNLNIGFSSNGYTASDQNLQGILGTYFSDVIGYACTGQSKTLDIETFSADASEFAELNMTSAETSLLNGFVVSLQFNLDVTFNGSNGVSDTITFGFDYRIDGRFWNVPVRSFTSEQIETITF